MKMMEEMALDLDFKRPKLFVYDKLCVIENVSSIVMIGENSLTVEADRESVTVKGRDFIIKEIFGGRMLVEGRIQGIEFLRSQNKDKDRGIQD